MSALVASKGPLQCSPTIPAMKMRFLCWWLLCWQLPTMGYQLSFFWFILLFCFSLRCFTFILHAAVLYRRKNSPWAVRRYILYDGDVDAIWIENMNSVMDDNKLLTLTNGERIRLEILGRSKLKAHVDLQSPMLSMPRFRNCCSVHGVLVLQLRKHCAMLFEVFDLQYASPATVSRCGMLYVAWLSLGLEWWWLLKSW